VCLLADMAAPSHVIASDSFIMCKYRHFRIVLMFEINSERNKLCELRLIFKEQNIQNILVCQGPYLGTRKEFSKLSLLVNIKKNLVCQGFATKEPI
jgi:hypothetical protein